MRKITVNNTILIENLRKKWGSKKLLNKFTSKDWSTSGLYSLLRRIDATGSADRKVGNERPRSDSQHHKGRLTHCSQENALGTHKSAGEIERYGGCNMFCYDVD